MVVSKKCRTFAPLLTKGINFNYLINKWQLELLE